jgi:hypothetical protein
MFCTGCGKERENNRKFCTNCGSRFDTEDTTDNAETAVLPISPDVQHQHYTLPSNRQTSQSEQYDTSSEAMTTSQQDQHYFQQTNYSHSKSQMKRKRKWLFLLVSILVLVAIFVAVAWFLFSGLFGRDTIEDFSRSQDESPPLQTADVQEREPELVPITLPYVMPDILGLSYTDARNLLTELNLTLQIELEQIPSEEDSGVVLETIPYSGEVLASGDKVIVRYSMGPSESPPTPEALPPTPSPLPLEVMVAEEIFNATQRLGETIVLEITWDDGRVTLFTRDVSGVWFMFGRAGDNREVHPTFTLKDTRLEIRFPTTTRVYFLYDDYTGIFGNEHLWWRYEVHQ